MEKIPVVPGAASQFANLVNVDWTAKTNDFVFLFGVPLFKEDFIMLVLSRKPGEKIHIGSEITITVVVVKGNKVRIGIEAPEEIPILRGELNEFLGMEGVGVGAGNGQR